MTTLIATSQKALGGLLALALAPAFWPGDAAAHSCDDPFSTDLIAGQSIDAGDVKVCNDATTLTVTYEATYPWCLLETNLHVATIPDPPADPNANIPQTPTGNPIPGHFDHGDEHDCVGTAVFEIPLDEIGGGVGPGDTVIIAAHAEVEDAERQEGAWGEGTRFVARGSWAMYFEYMLQEPFLCGDETSRCVFVTSTTLSPILGGLAGADAICQDFADADGSLAAPGTYRTWLSDATASPSTRFTQASVPYKLVDGSTIADNWADLTDGGLQSPISRTEQGGNAPVLEVWTGTTAQGVQGIAAGLDCQAWTSNDISNVAAIGGTSFTDPRWSFFARSGCLSMNSLYCFQQ